jgi:hypothetical protein
MTGTQKHDLYRVQDANWNLYRAEDGTTRFPLLRASSIAARINGRVIK